MQSIDAFYAQHMGIFNYKLYPLLLGYLYSGKLATVNKYTV